MKKKFSSIFIPRFIFLLFLILKGISNESMSINILSNKENEEQNKIKERAQKYITDFAKINSLIKLTDKNYTDFINKFAFTLVYFHSSYNNNSINFLPIFEQISNYLNKYNDFIPPRVVSIDLSDDENNSELQSRYRFSDFPTLIFFNSMYKKTIEYSSYMTTQSIISFVIKGIKDVILTMNKVELFNQLLNPNYTYVSIFSIKNVNIDEYYKISSEYNYILFANCIGFQICKNYFNKSLYNNDIIIAKMFNCENDFTCPNKEVSKPILIPYNYTNIQLFKNFISINSIPRIHYFSIFSYELMKLSNFNTIIYIKGENEKKSNKEISIILKKVIDEIIIWGSIIDPTKSQRDYEYSKLIGLELEDFKDKGNVIIYTSNPEKKDYNTFRMDKNDINNFKEINENNIKKFVSEFKLNIIKKDIKSENIPKQHPKRNLHMIVGKTYQKEILKNNNKTIVLIFITLNMNKLHFYEDQIERITIKFDKYFDNLTFAFLDPALNEIPDMPKYDITKTIFYRYYYKNKSMGFVDYLLSCEKLEDIENWIIDLYSKEYELNLVKINKMKSYISNITDYIKDEKNYKEMQKEEKRKYFRERLGIKQNIKNNKNNKTQNNKIKNKEENNEKHNSDL